jgi:hypothetical protein
MPDPDKILDRSADSVRKADMNALELLKEDHRNVSSYSSASSTPAIRSR